MSWHWPHGNMNCDHLAPLGQRQGTTWDNLKTTWNNLEMTLGQLGERQIWKKSTKDQLLMGKSKTSDKQDATAQFIPSNVGFF